MIYSRPRSRTPNVSFSCGLAAIAIACSSGGGTEPPPQACLVSGVNVSPASVEVFVGASQPLAASVASTNCASTPQVNWQSSATAVASVSSSGEVTGVAEGTATITAGAGGQSGTVAITVRRVPVASVAVTAPVTTVLVGGTVQAVAEPRSSTGLALIGRAVTWHSSNQARATVSPAGLITGVGAGAVTITATSEGQSGTLAITVNGTPSLQVTSITPSAGATAVSIETTIQIQFNAALSASTVNPATVVVSRAGGGGVAGVFAVSGNTVTFTPAASLTEFGSSYTVSVGTGVLSAVGNFLGTPFSASFTTAFWDPAYYYRITNEAYAGTSLDTFSNTFGCFLGNNGTFTGQFWYFVPVAGHAGFFQLRNQFQGDTKALEGSDSPNRCFLTNPGVSTGQSWRVVAYGAPYANGYRLQTQQHGAAKSLGAVLVNNEPFPGMMATANSSNQVWYFSRLARR